MKFFAHEWSKIPAQKKPSKFCLTSRIFLVPVLLSASVERCFVSRMRNFYISDWCKTKNLCFAFQSNCLISQFFPLWDPLTLQPRVGKIPQYSFSTRPIFGNILINESYIPFWGEEVNKKWMILCNNSKHFSGLTFSVVIMYHQSGLCNNIHKALWERSSVVVTRFSLN